MVFVVAFSKPIKRALIEKNICSNILESKRNYRMDLLMDAAGFSSIHCVVSINIVFFSPLFFSRFCMHMIAWAFFGVCVSDCENVFVFHVGMKKKYRQNKSLLHLI